MNAAGQAGRDRQGLEEKVATPTPPRAQPLAGHRATWTVDCQSARDLRYQIIQASHFPVEKQESRIAGFLFFRIDG